MAIGDSYATEKEYRDLIGKTDPAEDAIILNDLKAVSRYLDGKLGRFFSRDTSAVARVYVARSSDTLWVDDISATPTSIKIDQDGDGDFADETALAATDYELLPLNADKEPEPRPWTQMRLTTWGTIGSFSEGERVQVTARFGWPAVPEAIRRATIHLTAILRLETPRATRRIPELGEAIEASAEAQGIIRQLTDAYKVMRFA